MVQQATIPGPVPGTRMSDAYVREIIRFAFFWAWPMVNMYNRVLTYQQLPGAGLAGGVLPVAPPNHLCMLRDYIEPSERAVACPNQDVVYGHMMLDLGGEPVVVQVPDFSDRFWVYQVVDQRTDSFADLGAMYGTGPGCYLIAHTDWTGEVPDGIAGFFRCPTRIGAVFPRVFMDDTADDRLAVRSVLNQITGYPVSEFDGHPKAVDWADIPSLPGDTGDTEVRWVQPDRFVNQLHTVLDYVPPQPGEEALYGQIHAVLTAAESEPRLLEVMTEAARQSEKELVIPLFQFRNYGLPLPHNWTHAINGAQFGTDYFTRTAVAKSNIFVNKRTETTYFYQDLDANGDRLNGVNAYSVTFADKQLPPARGFWSLTLYNEHHFFHPNGHRRYSLGTKNKTLQYNSDGSLTLQIWGRPLSGHPESNWLPAPDGDFSLYLRAYWPAAEILDGRWTPPAVENHGPTH
ncbi:MAG TPA: DUF1254 domain-containing protein [Mycobacterium sp.]|nr:DUF1254 domain-containing protein [Mycobacterium sp.]